MNKSDVIVIGGGLAGLTAANVATAQGKKVTVITYGSGSLPLFSGAFDFFGRDDDGEFVASPIKGIENLPESHPYKKIGVKYIKDAIEFLTKLTAKYNLTYVGNLEKQIPVVTAAGTLKYSCLVPKSMDASNLSKAKKIFVVAVKGLKDFYSEMIAENLKKFLNKDIQAVEIDLGFLGGRDITSLDGAQFLEDGATAQNLVAQLKNFGIGNDTAFILPPILGSDGNAVYEKVKSQVGAEIIETTCLPPSPPGMRLQKVLIQSLRDSGVKIFENTQVLRACKEQNKISGVVVQTAVREKIYRADKIILATGGFYSGGITMKNFEQPKEVIFNLPVYFPAGEKNWSNKDLFSDSPQGFSTTGVLVNENLSPSEVNGFENVRVVGNTLGGSDFIFERSAGGIALSSAYKAAMV